MTDIKGDRLCVNLGASQVRRRLKGQGFGVRKDRAAIESKLPYPRRAMYPLNLQYSVSYSGLFHRSRKTHEAKFSLDEPLKIIRKTIYAW